MRRSGSRSSSTTPDTCDANWRLAAVQALLLNSSGRQGLDPHRPRPEPVRCRRSPGADADGHWNTARNTGRSRLPCAVRVVLRPPGWVAQDQVSLLESAQLSRIRRGRRRVRVHLTYPTAVGTRDLGGAGRGCDAQQGVQIRPRTGHVDLPIRYRAPPSCPGHVPGPRADRRCCSPPRHLRWRPGRARAAATRTVAR
jgi:hypothetical protein